jgi:syntaxin-binding protein 5
MRTQFAPHRIIVSHHRDMTVKFQDLNAQLLTSSPEEPLLSSFPRLASELTIDILELLADSAVSEHFPPVLLQNVDIQSVQLSPYTLEVAVALTTGEIIIYHLDGVAGRYWESADSEFVCLEHIVGTSVQRFHPTLMLRAQRGSVVSYSLSDIGLPVHSSPGTEL